DGRGRVERIGRRRREDAYEGTGLAVELDDRVGALGGEFYLGHLAQAHDLAVRRLQRQRTEALRRLQRRLHGDGIGDVFVLRLARRGQEVGRAERSQHLRRG